eukprot:EG_transcript_11101
MSAATASSPVLCAASSSASAAAPPASYLCPITMDVMQDPVMDCHGHNFERAAIVDWLQRRAECPMTRSRITADQLFPNVTLRDQIAEWSASLSLPDSDTEAAASDGATPQTEVERTLERLRLLVGACERLLCEAHKRVDHLIPGSTSHQLTQTVQLLVRTATAWQEKVEAELCRKQDEGRTDTGLAAAALWAAMQKVESLHGQLERSEAEGAALSRRLAIAVAQARSLQQPGPQRANEPAAAQPSREDDEAEDAAADSGERGTVADPPPEVKAEAETEAAPALPGILRSLALPGTPPPRPNPATRAPPRPPPRRSARSASAAAPAPQPTNVPVPAARPRAAPKPAAARTPKAAAAKRPGSSQAAAAKRCRR